MNNSWGFQSFYEAIHLAGGGRFPLRAISFQKAHAEAIPTEQKQIRYGREVCSIEVFTTI